MHKKKRRPNGAVLNGTVHLSSSPEHAAGKKEKQVFFYLLQVPLAHRPTEAPRRWATDRRCWPTTRRAAEAEGGPPGQPLPDPLLGSTVKPRPLSINNAQPSTPGRGKKKERERNPRKRKTKEREEERETPNRGERANEN